MIKWKRLRLVSVTHRVTLFLQLCTWHFTNYHLAYFQKRYNGNTNMCSSYCVYSENNLGNIGRSECNCILLSCVFHRVWIVHSFHFSPNCNPNKGRTFTFFFRKKKGTVIQIKTAHWLFRKRYRTCIFNICLICLLYILKPLESTSAGSWHLAITGEWGHLQLKPL